MESTSKLAPTELVTMADEESQVLKHSNQWVETINPSWLKCNRLSGTMIHHLETHRHHHTFPPNSARTVLNGYMSHQKNLQETQTYRGCIWSFCGKCGRNGKWVCTHTKATHRSSKCLQWKVTPTPESSYYNWGRSNNRSDNDNESHKSCFGHHGSSPSRSRTPPGRKSSPLHERSHSVSFRHTPPPSPQAKFSLFDKIHAFIGDS